LRGDRAHYDHGYKRLDRKQGEKQVLREKEKVWQAKPGKEKSLAS